MQKDKPTAVSNNPFLVFEGCGAGGRVLGGNYHSYISELFLHLRELTQIPIWTIPDGGTELIH